MSLSPFFAPYEFGLARRVRPSRPASACSFSILRLNRLNRVRAVWHLLLNVCCNLLSTSVLGTRSVCLLCVVIPFILDVSLVDASWSSRVTQKKVHTGFLHLPSAVPAFIFIARRIQPSLSLVDREVEFCVLGHFLSCQKNYTASENGFSDDQFSNRIFPSTHFHLL